MLVVELVAELLIMDTEVVPAHALLRHAGRAAGLEDVEGFAAILRGHPHLGLEIAQALSRLGVEVAGFDGARRIAGLPDEDVNAALVRSFGEEFALHLGAPVELTETRDGIAVRSDQVQVVADAVVAAIGRRPNLDDLGLDTLGVELDERGMPPVDPTTMRIADLPVFLAGDANGQVPLLHEAVVEPL